MKRAASALFENVSEKFVGSMFFEILGGRSRSVPPQQQKHNVWSFALHTLRGSTLSGLGLWADFAF
jgi:hypothetical protein